MKILAVDTALGACSVAVLDADRIMAHRLTTMERGHAEALAPMVETAMDAAGMAFGSIDRLAVTIGPGTFTGQRVGLAFMRGLRLALNKPLVGVTTLAAMSHQAMAETGRAIGVGLHDARRNEVYLEIVGDEVMPPCVLTFDEAMQRIAQLSAPIAVAGTAAPRAHALLSGSALSTVLQPDALWVARLARQMPVSDLVPRPLYLRPPDAKLPVRR